MKLTLDTIYDILPREAADWACEHVFDDLLKDVRYGFVNDDDCAAMLDYCLFFINDVKDIDNDDNNFSYFTDDSFSGIIGLREN